jgi:hypothetical protein
MQEGNSVSWTPPQRHATPQTLTPLAQDRAKGENPSPAPFIKFIKRIKIQLRLDVK